MVEHTNPIAAISLALLLLVISGFLIFSGDIDKEDSSRVEEGEEEIHDLKKSGIESLYTASEFTTTDASITFEFHTTSEKSDDKDKESILSMSYSFPAPTMVREGKYDVPKMLQLQNHGKPGAPIVPVFDAQILLPQGEIPTNIEVTAKTEVSLEGTYFLRPGGWPMILSLDDQPPPPEEVNLTIYNSDTRYPGILSSEPTVQEIRGFQILILRLYPMHYIPAQKKVVYLERIDVSITTIHTGDRSLLYRGLAKDRNLVETMVDNPSELTTYKLNLDDESQGGIKPCSIVDPGESYDYVIITNDALASTFQSLADHKNSSGIRTVVIKIEDITSDPDYDGNDTQEEIRNFIRDAYLNWNITYVLLGGDDEIILHRGCYGYVDSVSGPTEDDDIPTDLYYGGLSGNWDNDGDGIYGEMDSVFGGNGTSGEESDLLAEVFVGRAPVNTISEAQTFVDKTIFFEANPRPKHVTLHGEKDSSGPYYLDYIKNGDGGSDCVENYIPASYNITHLYEREGDAIDTTIWETEIANDTLFVNHGGHGNVQSYEIIEGTFYLDTDADDVVNTYYPIHLSIACYSGSFDGRNDTGSYVSDKDCMAEEYIINPDGGMVACILNTRFGWFISFDVTKYSGELDIEFYEQLFNNYIINIGKTLQKAKEEYATDALIHTTYRWVVYEWNLLGDPTLQIFGDDTIPPVANAGPDNSTNEDSPIFLNGSASTDDSGYIAWYNWTFGDGNYFNGSGSAYAIIEYIYADPGYYTAILNISDSFGNWDYDTVNITVYDATPPNTTLTIGIPKHRNNTADDWNVTQTTPFTLSAVDEYSALNFTWYKIDSNYYVYGGTFDFSGYGEGVHNLTYGSEDSVGNNDTGTSLIINVDNSEPTTNLSIDAPKYGNEVFEINVTRYTEFNISAIDNFAGVNITWWYVNDIGNYSEIAPFDFSSFGEGTYTLYYGAKDFLGNNDTTPNWITVVVDDSKPLTLLTIGTPKYGDEVIEINVTSSTSFTLLASDNAVGVNFTWYMVDGDYYNYSSPFDFSGYGEGIYTLIYGSEDLVENNESGTPLTVKVDDSEPTTILSIGSPKYGGGVVDINVTSLTQFTINAFDNFAGVDIIWWYVNDLGYYFETNSFNFSNLGEGTYTLFYGARDLLGNNDTTPNSLYVIVDDSKPTTTLIIGIPKYGDGVIAINVTHITPFNLSAYDDTVGVETSWWYVNDLDNYTEGDAFDFSALPEGTYIFYYGSRDLLGINESAQSIIVFVDREPPTTEQIIVGEPKSRDYPFQMYNVTKITPFTLNASDAYSGVNFTWYIIGGVYFEGTSFNLSGYLDGEHTIFYGSQDNLGYNETWKMESVFLDTTAPNSSLDIGEPRSRANEEDDWNVTGFTIFTVISNDNHSGVGTEWYIVDGDYFEGSTFTLDGYPDGMHVITYGARDKLGNNETGNMTIVFADTHPPSTTLEIMGLSYRDNESDYWNVTKTTFFSLSANDEYSGVNFTWYTIDGTYYEGTSFDLYGYEEGMYTITWGALDLGGNNESGNIMNVVIDNSSSITDLTVGFPRFRGLEDDLWNVTAQTPITLISQDSYSGVDTVWYTIDGIYFENTNLEVVEFNLSGFFQGPHTITWGAKDNLNHNETNNVMIVYLDNSSPQTELMIGDLKYRENSLDTWNVSQATTFNLISGDEFCGISSSWYTFDGEYFEGSEFMLIGANDGLHNITFGAQDNLGNNETANSINIRLDMVAPTVTILIDQEPVNETPVKMNSSTPVTLIAEDDLGSGVGFIWFSLDGGSTYLVYDSPFPVPLNTTSIMYGAEDNVGNNATAITLRVIVDDSEPVIDDDGDDDEIEDVNQSDDKDMLDMIMDFLYIFIILIVVIIVLVILVLLRRKKDKEEIVAFQSEEEDKTTFQVEGGREEEGTVEFQEDDGSDIEWE